MTVDFDLRDTARGTVLCWLATVDGNGQPSVSPKEIWHLDGDRILIADIASAGSVRSVRANPKVCVSLLDIFRQRGHKCLGTARVIAPDEDDFNADAAPLADKAGPDFHVRHVIAVKIERAIPVLAPSWRVFPDRSVDEHMRRTQAVYGVRPA